MAYLLIEKYLTDSLRAISQKEVDRISGADLMPSWLPSAQYQADSARAQYYFKVTKDSGYLKKFFQKRIPPSEKDSTTPKEKPLVVYQKSEATEPKNLVTLKKKTN